MTFDELQRTWQSQESGFRLSIDSEMLHREIKRNKAHFERIVFWRDVREVGVAILLFVFFMYHGLKSSIWPLVLLALSVGCVAMFMTVDRIIQKRQRPRLTKSLTSCIESCLAQVNHQVWLLKNVLWWYLLPPGIGIGIFIAYVAWKIRNTGRMPLVFVLAYALFCIFLYWGIYLLNQWAVRKQLIPRKRELEQLLDSLRSSKM